MGCYMITPVVGDPSEPPPPPIIPLNQQIISAARFLEQATFGPTATQIDIVKTQGLASWLTQQFQWSESTLPNGLNVNQVRAQLFLNMANGTDQLRQRMMFALSQIIVVSSNKNVNGEELILWVRLLSRNAFGNFRALLKEATLSPTMGKFLDLANSNKASAMSAPSEN